MSTTVGSIPQDFCLPVMYQITLHTYFGNMTELPQNTAITWKISKLFRRWYRPYPRLKR